MHIRQSASFATCNRPFVADLYRFTDVEAMRRPHNATADAWLRRYGKTQVSTPEERKASRFTAVICRFRRNMIKYSKMRRKRKATGCNTGGFNQGGATCSRASLRLPGVRRFLPSLVDCSSGWTSGIPLRRVPLRHRLHWLDRLRFAAL
jgi:hypothetical protein